MPHGQVIEYAVEYDSGCLGAYPLLQAWRSRMRSHPNVAKFLAGPHRHRFPDANYVREVQVSLGRI